MSLLVICETLGAFLNTLTLMRSILFRIVRISCCKFKCSYLKNKKLFLDFLFHFWNLHQIFDILKKKVIVIANLFPKLQTKKNLARPLSKKFYFRTPFDSKHVKGTQTLVKFEWEHFYQLFSLL